MYQLKYIAPPGFDHDFFFLVCPSQGIYRVNGAKSRVEKLCQAFENGKDLVELSDHSPHDISNVLKLYLRQVGVLSELLKTSQSVKTKTLYTDAAAAQGEAVGKKSCLFL